MSVANVLADATLAFSGVCFGTCAAAFFVGIVRKNLRQKQQLPYFADLPQGNY